MLRIVREHVDALAGALADIGRELARCDYTPGRPPWLTDRAVRIDREVCRRAACERCGRKGLRYHSGWHVSGVRHRYRAYAVCPGCGHWAEF
jgi:hypothetical protein